MSAPILDDVAGLARTQGALIGLDLGTRTIGVAVSDTLRISATALETIQRTRFAADAARIERICTERAVTGIVLGLPLNMDGSEGPRCQATRAFARNLAGCQHLPIAFWDERLTTVSAERTLLEADTSRRRRASVIDKLAAAIILQGALDRLSTIKRSGATGPSGEVWRRDEIESPCIKVCMIHPESGYCLGCRRTTDEIARWSSMSAAERERIRAELPRRRAGPSGRRGGAAARHRQRE